MIIATICQNRQRNTTLLCLLGMWESYITKQSVCGRMEGQDIKYIFQLPSWKYSQTWSKLVRGLILRRAVVDILELKVVVKISFLFKVTSDCAWSWVTVYMSGFVLFCLAFRILTVPGHYHFLLSILGSKYYYKYHLWSWCGNCCYWRCAALSLWKEGEKLWL